MAASLERSPVSPTVPLLDSVGTKPIKANLKVPACPALREVVGDALDSAPKKAVAATMQKDRSQLRRELAAGTLELRDLETLGPEFYIDLAKLLLETYGPLATPVARARQLIREMRQTTDEFEQLLEHIA